jgi:hypothetical protein
MTELRSNTGRKEAVITLLQVSFGILCTFVLVNLYYVVIGKLIDNGGDVSLKFLTLVNSFGGLLTLVNILVLITTGILFMFWFRRAYTNVHKLGIGWLRWKPGWAVGAWFVPVISLYVPYQIMRDIWSATAYSIRKDFDTSRFNADIIGWWWALFIVANVLTGLLARLELLSGNDEASLFIRLQYISLFSNLLSAAGALITIRMVRQYSVMEEILHDGMNSNPEND